MVCARERSHQALTEMTYVSVKRFYSMRTRYCLRVCWSCNQVRSCRQEAGYQVQRYRSSKGMVLS